MNWISIKDQQPPLGERVLVYKSFYDTGFIVIGWRCCRGIWEYERSGPGQEMCWMNLPDFPVIPDLK